MDSFNHTSLDQNLSISDLPSLFPIASSLALSICFNRKNYFLIKPELKWPNDITIKGKICSQVC